MNTFFCFNFYKNRNLKYMKLYNQNYINFNYFCRKKS